MTERIFLAIGCLAGAVACSDASPTAYTPIPGAPFAITALGLGRVPDRWTAELAVRGDYAYTTTWGTRGTVSGVRRGNVIYVWDVRGATPALVDSAVTDDPDVTTIGDVQVSDDGALLVAATERYRGGLLVYSLDDPRRPRLLTQYVTKNTASGVHTAEVARVNGKLYAFLSIDQPVRDTLPGPQLVVVDLSNPAAPNEVLAKPLGTPIQHDVYVRDGTLFTAEWDGGVRMWDVGGARGGTPAKPVELGRVTIPGGAAHNAWWVHDSTTGEARWLLIGQELPGTVGTSSEGDVFVADLKARGGPKLVAVYHEVFAGTHNFSVDEQKGIAYAAYYNFGVRALDVRGDLSQCRASARRADGLCDLTQAGRLVAHFDPPGTTAAYVWGVQRVGSDVLYASDMINGLWKLDVSNVRRP